LHKAAKEGREDAVRALIDAGADLNAQDVYGSTPLHLCAFQGHTGVAKLLIDVRRIELNCRDVFQRTALEHACRQGNAEIVRLLLQGGKKDARIDVNACNRRGETALHRSATYGHVQCVKLLLRGGALVDCVDTLYSHTPLHRAASRGQAACVRALIRSGANVTLLNCEQSNALHLAVLSGSVECVRELCDAIGSSARSAPFRALDARNRRRRTPYQEALKMSSKAIVSLLYKLEHRRQVTRLTELGVPSWTPRQVAAWIELIGHEQHAAKFADNDVTGKLLLAMSNEHLKDELQISSWGVRQHILQSVRHLVRSEPSSSSEENDDAATTAVASSSASTSSTSSSSIVDELTQISYDDLRMLEELGRGFFGYVRRALWFGTEVAVKVVYRSNFRDKDDGELFQQEVRLLSTLHHPNIVQFLGVSMSPDDQPALVTEYMGRSSLRRLIEEDFEYIDEHPLHRYTIIMGVINGMVYLHDMRIAHRDLSTSNILIAMDGTTKIADFGVSRVLSQRDADEGNLTGSIGALCCMAPEVFRGEAYDLSADVFSFGMVLYEIFAGCRANGDVEPRRFAFLMANHNFRPQPPHTMPPPFVFLYQQCIHAEPSARSTFVELQARIQLIHSSNRDESSESSVDSGAQEREEREPRQIVGLYEPTESLSPSSSGVDGDYIIGDETAEYLN
jgi:ankyrin repeat protein/tRNA A-37 threonylcarbamoyl transferase component Bud32